MKRFFSQFIILCVIIFWSGESLLAKEAGNLKEWDLLAIQDQGRRKPMYTFAREMVIRLHGRATYQAPDKKKWAANEMALSVFLQDRDWEKEPFLLVGYRPLVQDLGLAAERKYFSFDELTQVPSLSQQVLAVHEKKQRNETLSRKDQELENVAIRLDLFSQWVRGVSFRIVPSLTPKEIAWMPLFEFFKENDSEKVKPVEGPFLTMIASYKHGDFTQFNQAAETLRGQLRALNPERYPKEKMLQFEYAYYRLHAFDWAMVSYGVAFLFLLMGYYGLKKWLKWIGVAAAFAGILWQGVGVTMRCMIAGRPPVTNMYESVVWVALGTGLFGFLFYLRYRNALYLLAALPVSFLCLLAVSRMPVAMPDRLDPLVPVLRDNFWLTVHVLTITLSYAAFALAMGFGHIVLFRYIRHPQETAKDSVLHHWLYRVMQLGVLLLAAGTILGGVWANYSWGRFWGWDPKETWALIALLIYIFVIHGRIAGWWGVFGLAVGSVVCFSGVVMTWYGVNFVLGKGLHSYGFGVGGTGYAVAFIILEALFVAVACWRYQKTKLIKT
ncbi:MAG: cytochrome c biogenesis protein CcsA [Verrucomicrobiae bacterium]|nr:cytochrome c biogenesis protein CcsA [Verrucomicrobiae bacterium]